MKTSHAAEARNGFAQLTTDFMFKRIFAGPDSKSILISFLNHFVGNGEITDARILSPEHLPPTSDDRRSIFDINVRTIDGSEYIIEMQLARQAHFRERALFYSAYPIINQEALAKSEHEFKNPSSRFNWDFNLKPVRFLGIVNFTMEHTKEWASQPCRYQSSYRLYDDTSHELLHDKLQFVFLELNRFNKSESELEDIYDKWMFLLKNMSELSKRPDTCDEKEFDKLFELAKICNFTPDEYRDYQNSQKMNYDNQNIIDYAKQTGREEGLEKGREEGRKETGIEIARNMLADGASPETVRKYTGLDEMELESLKADLQ